MGSRARVPYASPHGSTTRGSLVQVQLGPPDASGAGSKGSAPFSWAIASDGRAATRGTFLCLVWSCWREHSVPNAAGTLGFDTQVGSYGRGDLHPFAGARCVG